MIHLTPEQWERERRKSVRTLHHMILILKRNPGNIPEPRRAELEAEARELRDNARRATYPTI